MGIRWGGREEGQGRDSAPTVAIWSAGLVIGLTLGWAGHSAVEDDPEPKVVTPKVKLETEALLDAATIEMRGYGADGKPGVYLYECAHDGKRLVCTQVEEK